MTEPFPLFSQDAAKEWNNSSTNSESDDTLLDDETTYQNLHKMEDIESQPILKDGYKDKTSNSPIAAEYSIPTQKKLIYLSVYFGLNLGLTLYNKALLGNVSSQFMIIIWEMSSNQHFAQFHFPWLLTAFHAGSASLGCFILDARGYVKPTKLGAHETLILSAFSVLFTINIAISNVSL